jgi:two-component system response regulator YesN
MHDYISRKRIQSAKAYLAGGSKSLTEIAENVGLLNALSLIRLFKKYENITPGAYREMHKLDNRRESEAIDA